MNPKYRETENTLKIFTLDQFAEMIEVWISQ